MTLQCCPNVRLIVLAKTILLTIMVPSLYAPMCFSQQADPKTTADQFKTLYDQIWSSFSYHPDFHDRSQFKRDPQGRVLGNCGVFAQLSHETLTAQGYLPRFVNVTARAKPAEHLVTVVRGNDGLEWVFDNRRPGLYPASALKVFYPPSKRTAKFVGYQKGSWASLKLP